MPCDNYFEERGIPYDESYQDIAVHEVRSDGTLNLREKKELILCWFDTTGGQWCGLTFDNTHGRELMRDFLDRSPYDTFEELLDAKEEF